MIRKDIKDLVRPIAKAISECKDYRITHRISSQFLDYLYVMVPDGQIAYEKEKRGFVKNRLEFMEATKRYIRDCDSDNYALGNTCSLESELYASLLTNDMRDKQTFIKAEDNFQFRFDIRLLLVALRFGFAKVGDEQFHFQGACKLANEYGGTVDAKINAVTKSLFGRDDIVWIDIKFPISLPTKLRAAEKWTVTWKLKEIESKEPKTSWNIRKVWLTVF